MDNEILVSITPDNIVAPITEDTETEETETSVEEWQTILSEIGNSTVLAMESIRAELAEMRELKTLVLELQAQNTNLVGMITSSNQTLMATLAASIQTPQVSQPLTITEVPESVSAEDLPEAEIVPVPEAPKASETKAKRRTL